ncbi:hypothetical protein EVG20_g419 [Dentipellis fragilis]|uniref:Midasin n=1 Tax=Dentipellis fragilis TaxID=205917 RepID=A0A4Y9ZF35_9AGAM|nr:hypothetical protein EVG20_g419 [Dentipellis fragilis]
MSSLTFQNPLAVKLVQQVTALASFLPQGSNHIRALHGCNSFRQLLTTLSQLLVVPSLTAAVASTFRPLLFDLCARLLDDDTQLEQKLSALCFLLQPYEELYPIFYEFIRQHIQESGPLAFVLESEPSSSIPSESLQRILLAYYRILQANRELPRQLGWPLSPFSRLIWDPHPDNGVRFLAIRCYALQSGMGEAERGTLEEEVVGKDSEVDCPLEFGQNINGEANIVDGWILPILEARRLWECRDAIAADTQNYFTEDHTNVIGDSDLSPFVTNIHGILMFRTSNSVASESGLIPTPTTVEALRSIALRLSLRLPVLLTSAPSAGKSLLLTHLAGILHPDVKNQIITIALADTSLDPRSLLGSYISSPTNPGTFEWKEGVLVRAMREGRWVLLEDIDRASNEVLGTLKPLVQSMGLDKWVGGRVKLEVPGRGAVVAAESFAVFATRSLQPSHNGVFPKAAFFGSHKFDEVILRTPSSEELRLILDSKFPRLSGSAVSGIIRLWEGIKNLGVAPSSRQVGLRELERFCVRINALLPSSFQPMQIDVDAELEAEGPHTLPLAFANPTLREEIYLEARDVFFGAGTLTAAASAHMEAIAAITAEHLALSLQQRDWVLTGRVPEFAVEKDVNGRNLAVRVGHIRLPARRKNVEIATHSMSRPFAMHRPAVILLSRIATAISLSEPILLTGETGTGKTSLVTHVASLLNRPLISLNLSQQSESSDLLGGFKPVDARVPGSELQEQFLELFRGTFSAKKNAKFEESVRKAVQEGKWKRTVGLWKESARMAKDRIRAKLAESMEIDGTKDELDSGAPRKRRRTDAIDLAASETRWVAFEQGVTSFEIQHVQGKSKLAFSFVEGPLVKALRSGDWVLLDEINLASPETLEAVSGLLQSPTASITLTEQGSLEPVARHPDFRLFACMNPATDVGKKDLPPNIRSRFTEIDVPSPDSDRETLLSIITQYIGASAVSDKAAIMDIAEFYIAVKHLAETRQIADGSNHRPHFSIRTLSRALTFAADIAGGYSLRRALWEGFLMAFTMILDAPSAEIVTALARKHILSGVRNTRSLLAREPAAPSTGSIDDYVKFGPFFLEKGPLSEDPVENYIMTPSVEKKLIDLARIILTRRFPVLIEGPTSAGKTSSIEYLARRTGHQFVRINNHEHTDIQEYLGTYVSDPVTGKLVFKDGLLVQALRRGDWIVLDELNLAPTDVLEALNRLLDDNRELVIPETQEVVRPHPHFVLFATQNPPGLYAGRKVLSRAFRNRFLEVHFEDVPQAELETILCQRCRIAPSYGHRIVEVFRELQKRRQASRVFESKHGFATLRDLFRWAGRDAVGYQELAENGYMLLAERARRDDDKAVVKEVIESVLKVKVDEDPMYDFNRQDSDLQSLLGFRIPSSTNIVWTRAMRRLLILVGRALRFNEPILLVGETGTGKTSICQIYADAVHKRLVAVNCHQNTETADLIGGLRPVRDRTAIVAEATQQAIALLSEHGVAFPSTDCQTLMPLLDNLAKSPSLKSQVDEVRLKFQRAAAIFQWHDGPLVETMQQGDVVLLDEISLADDSVLERLNSVLEPERTVVLAERGGDNSEDSIIRATDGFQLLATMNPGGDFGKKELSPALRNRFTEIWVPAVDDRSDIEQIVDSSWRHECLRPYTTKLLDFYDWLSVRAQERHLLGLRDILAWVDFANSVLSSEAMKAMPLNEIFHHAAYMTCLDGLGSLPQLAGYLQASLQALRDDAVRKLYELAPLPRDEESSTVPVHDPSRFVQLGAFAVPRGPLEHTVDSYNLQAPTTQDNAMRVVRACQVLKPILLEGSPGVGKTSLIKALANICGYHLCRINLSDQTELADLFGSDLPAEGGGPNEFAWKDAEFLSALQEGHWVLLDEMNLAPQAVLEGLNAVLDHRGTVYIPELGRSFTRHPSFRVFAAQNPIQQGGGRKGLPKSFVNRFSRVYVQPLTSSDLLQICRHGFPDYPVDWLKGMISFTTNLEVETTKYQSFARAGAPWEFNLRDVTRWLGLLKTPSRSLHPIEHLHNVYLTRFRTVEDQTRAQDLFTRAFGIDCRNASRAPQPSISPRYVQVGHFITSRKNFSSSSRSGRLLQSHLSPMEALGVALEQNSLVILTGPHDSGKTTMVRFMADLTGNVLHEVSISSGTDTMDLLGTFEQVDVGGRRLALSQRCLALIEAVLRTREGSRMQQLLQSSFPGSGSARSLTSDSDLHTLESVIKALGQVEALDDTQISERRELLVDIEHELSTSTSSGRFEWTDGPLIRALKEGHWILIDDANLCSPSVLDRLNSLCEPSGTITLNERGYVDGKVPIVTPHPAFRLFMSLNPQHGELSRAMRNRGVEIFVSNKQTPEDLKRIQEYLRLPLGFPSYQSGVLAIEFELARRGLLRLQPVQSEINWPSGQTIDQDSPSSSLLHLSAPILSSSSESLYEAILQFTTSSAIPAYNARLSRFLSNDPIPADHHALKPLGVIVGAMRKSPMFREVEEIRGRYGRIWPAYSDLLTYQPVDFFMKSIVLSHSYPDLDRPSAHLATLRLIELFVRLVVDGHLDKLLEKPFATGVGKSKHEQPLVLQQAINAAGDVVASIYQLAHNLYETIEPELPEHDCDDVALTLRLQKYAKFVYKANLNGFNLSVIQAVTNWILESLPESSGRFSAVKGLVDGLKRLITPTSGLGLADIWAAFLQSLPSVKKHHLERLAKGSTFDSQAYRRRIDILNLMALQALSSTGDEKEALSLQETIQDIQNQLSSGATTDQTSAEAMDDALLLVKELSVLALLRTTDAQSATIVDSLLDIACQDLQGPLGRFVPYRHAVWMLQTNKLTVASSVTLHMSWLKALWNIHHLGGPSILLEPTQLWTTISKWDWNAVSLRSSRYYEANLCRHSKLVLMQSDSQMPRIQQLGVLFRRALLILSACFSESFDDATRAALQHEYQDSSTAHPLVDLIGLFQKSSHPQFGTAASKLLSIAKDIDRQESPAPCTMGYCWISLARVILELYVPNTPIDPSTAQQCTLDFWTEEYVRISEEIHLQSELERRTTGNDRNGMIDYLTQELQAAQHQLDNCPSLTTSRRSVDRLSAFWTEVSEFLTKVIPANKLDTLIALMRSGDAVANTREHVVQESITGFCQRLETVYTEFEDINSPLQWALLQMKLGLRLLAHASIPPDEGVRSVVESLVTFPSVQSCLMLRSSSVSGTNLGPEAFKFVLLQLTSLALEVDVGLEVSSQVEALASLYEQAVRMWSIDRSRREEAEKASQSLYRSNATSNEAVPDSVLEEQEFLALFPNFDEVLEDESDVGPQVKQSEKPLADPLSMQQLVNLHLRMLATDSHSRHGSLDAEIEFFKTRVSMEQPLIEANISKLPETLDQSSLVYQLTLIQDRYRTLETVSDTPGRPYDFYLDPNVPETRKASTLVESIKERLRVLIQEWPDQMVLQNLSERCDQILGLSLHSSVAKVLSALEQFLLQTEDWEMYANKENSLREHRQMLTTQIVEWRRLELSAWQGLLETQAKAFEQGASEWWFHLYELLVRGLLSAVDYTSEDGKDIEDYVDKLLLLVDNFVQSSPLGQFSRRLELLQSFETLLGHLAAVKTDQEREALERVARILYSTRSYYAQFLGKITQSLASQRAALEKEIKGFIKLASWRDINVQALKQSATRTHHQLYKCIRKFREIMRQPVNEHLRPDQASNSDSVPVFGAPAPRQHEHTTDEYVFPARAETVKQAPHLQQLPSTYKKYQTLLSTRIGDFIRTRPSHDVDSFAGEIISTADSLASESIPSDLPPERRQKQAKALLVRKRKAWSDLLKELKRVGFAANIKPEVRERQRSERWIREQLSIPPSHADSPDIKRMERYLYKLRGLLPDVRASLSDHNPDLPTRELQRGVMFLESGLTVAFHARSHLASLIPSYDTFIDVSRRLEMLKGTARVVASGAETLTQVLHIKDFVCRCHHALTETSRQLESFGRLPSAQPAPAELLQEINLLIASTETHRSSLFEVISHLKLTKTPLLLEDEYEAVCASVAHISKTISQLRSWEQVHTHVSCILTPVRTWIESEPIAVPPVVERDSSTAPADTDYVIDTLLTTVQDILSKLPEQPEDEDQENFVKETSRTLSLLSNALRVQTIVQTLDRVVSQLAGASEDDIQLNITRLLPFVKRYAVLVEEHLEALTKWTGSLFKLDYVVCTIIHTIAKQGFCKPPDLEEGSEEAEGGESTGGVGLGEGTGNENVSKEIEDESQVEGLKGDEDETKRDRQNEDENKDNTIEMAEDFEGEMEDVPDDGEEEEGEEGEDEEGEGPEDQLGDLDASDPAAVDEKLWGDEKGPDGEDEGKTQEDHSTSKGDDSEMVAKEGEKEKKEKEKDKQKPEDKPPTDNAPEETMHDEEAEEGADMAEPNEAGAPIDDYVKEAETLDLPEDLNMEMDEGGEQEGGPENEDEDIDMDEPGQQDDAMPEMEEGAEEQPGSPRGEETNPEEETSEDAVGKPDLEAGDGSAGDAAPEESMNTNVRDTATTGQGAGTQGTAGADAGAGEQANQQDDAQAVDGEQQAEAPNEPSAGGGVATIGNEQGTAPLQEMPQTGMSSNPLRSLGDALKEIRQRFDDILESSDTAERPVPQAADTAEPTAQLEYLHPDDEDQNMQALGPAGGEEVAKLSELQIVDEETTAEDADIPMDIDDQILPDPLLQAQQTSSLNAEPTSESSKKTSKAR